MRKGREKCRARVRDLILRQSELATALAAPTVTSASVSAADPGARLVSELAGVSEASVQKARIAMPAHIANSSVTVDLLVSPVGIEPTTY
jgi:hypothetical protein